MGNKQSGLDWAIHFSNQSTHYTSIKLHNSLLCPCSNQHITHYYRDTESSCVIWLAVEIKYKEPFARIMDCAFKFSPKHTAIFWREKIKNGYRLTGATGMDIKVGQSLCTPGPNSVASTGPSETSSPEVTHWDETILQRSSNSSPKTTPPPPRPGPPP